MASPSNIILISSDGERHVVCERTARVFRALATMIDSLGGVTDEPIPLPNVTGRILGKMLAWADHYVTTSINDVTTTQLSTTPTGASADLPVQPVIQPRVPKRTRPQMPSAVIVPTPWEREFLEKNRSELYELLLAANYLDAKRLMDILCCTVAGLIKGKDPAMIRKTFHVPEPHESDDVHHPSSEHDTA